MRSIQEIIKTYGSDRSRLLDILIDIQSEYGFVDNAAIKEIACQLDISSVDVEQTLSFYSFFSRAPRGKYTVYLNNSAVSNMMGRPEIIRAFEEETGYKFGSVSKDGLVGLFDTACIGMNDQEPAAIINGLIFTKLTHYRVKKIVKDFKAGKNILRRFR